MDGFEQRLARRLEELQAAGLRRALLPLRSAQGTRVQAGDRRLLNFSSNDYLGLANNPGLREAAHKSLGEWGVGAGASRLLCGSLGPFHDAEAALARFKGTGAALLFSTGFAAATGTIPAMVGPGDIVILDRLAHACLVDGARLSGARLRVFRHNDPADLERILRWTASRRGDGAVLIITESVFSMDGDLAPLGELVMLKERFGAWLMVDEAHATGLFGEGFGGLVQQAGLSGRIEVQMATLGKALGSAGGAICGSPTLIDFLINRARSLVYSTAPVPAAAAAAKAAVDFLATPAGAARVRRLWNNVAAMRERIRILGWPLPPAPSPIIPIILGEEHVAVAAATALRERDILLPAVRHPTVPRGRARLRLTLSAAHTEAELDQLTDALARALPPPPRHD
ncbi:MAG: 8-amino-7-oxononanoate synthase [Verrucomicrobiales bacterium]|nr:8-amino-7-oxononanoate synthase [Verrucomicrobiales bacterium]